MRERALSTRPTNPTAAPRARELRRVARECRDAKIQLVRFLYCGNDGGSSAYTAWGPDNREDAIRVPSQRRGIEMESTNLELKPSDPSNNPHLALGALLAAGLEGIENKRDPGEPTLVDPDTLSDAERTRRGIRRLPTSLGEALDALERDEVLRGALGDTLAKEYRAVKRSEVRGFEGKDTAFEVEQHFYKF